MITNGICTTCGLFDADCSCTDVQTTIVKQRTNYDCVLASLAMAAGRSYDDLFDYKFRNIIDKAQTCSGENFDEACRRAGFIKGENMRSIYIGGNVSAPTVRQLIWGRRALIQVPSLNYEKIEHMIYWDGYTIFDPSNQQVYKYLSSVFPTYVYIFNEAGFDPESQYT